MKKLTLFSLLAACTFSCSSKSGSDSGKDTTLIQDSIPASTDAVGVYSCFTYQTGKDSAFLSIDNAGELVTGNLRYYLFEKDKNEGKIVGKMNGDTLFADYTFMSEGTESVREIAFLRNGTNWIEGFGDVEEKKEKMVFKDKSNIKFSEGLIFKGTKCPEN